MLANHLVETVLQGIGTYHYKTQKFKEGLQQWLNLEPARRVVPKTPATDVVGWLAFEAFMNQINIGYHGLSKD